jgi:hypothetical protein
MLELIPLILLLLRDVLLQRTLVAVLHHDVDVVSRALDVQ